LSPGEPILSFVRSLGENRPIMCRFLAYSGEPVLLHDLLYRPAHSLVHQSCASRERDDPLNPDGFGVGWYAPEISPFPAVFRSVLPAWSSANLRSLARLTRSGCIFAHVRAASEGIGVSELNCHPFSAGPFLWMHNGTVAGYAEFREWARHYLSQAAFSQVLGTTDSEILFGLFLDMWDQAGSPSTPEGLLDAFRKTIAFAIDILRELGVKKASTLNLALTDGRTTLASRIVTETGEPARTLYCARGVRLVVENDAPRFEVGGDAAGAIVASEPLFDDPAWEVVPANSIVAVQPGGRAGLGPL
jgi:predicted glutamine amidotransferase